MTMLPMDVEAEQLLGDLAGTPDHEGDTRAEIMQRALAQSARMQVAVGRRLLAYRKQLADLDVTEDTFRREVDGVRERIARRAYEAGAFLDQLALMHREATGEATLDIPGVGRWSTRRQPERFALDDAALLRGLEGDERAMFVEPRTAVRVNTTKLREHLDELLATAEASIEADDPDERERLRVAAAEQIASLFPGVTYVPSEIKVNHDLNL